MYDVVALGELLVDFTPSGTSDHGNPCFERNPGGGPANMACAVSKLGGNVAFLSQVGDDMFGQALKKIVEREHVDCSQVYLSKEYKTTLAFVGLDEAGERSFSFYRQYGADTMMDASMYDLSILSDTQYFFLSSVLMAEGTSRDMSFTCLDEAKKQGVPVIFDPNLRFNLWKDPKEMKECVKKALKYCHIVKVSDEELCFLMDCKEIDKAALTMKEQYNIGILLVTKGGEGCVAYTDQGKVIHKGFAVEKPVDTTAAGDSFTGGFVKTLTEFKKPYTACTLEEIAHCIKVGNAVGSLTVRKRGAISALPSMEQVQELLG
ncbi:carbohydrate kinase family protein [Anaerosporobacter faecicola]|uniref:carbohydrate kinase family protein n=1 Tax=Anaerosporobacter faecicola TaxID=2718714 RepID=UPI00143BF8D4|nr:carbohydrate kinase [Anaerosporobacter faecicola]